MLISPSTPPKTLISSVGACAVAMVLAHVPDLSAYGRPLPKLSPIAKAIAKSMSIAREIDTREAYRPPRRNVAFRRLRSIMGGSDAAAAMTIAAGWHYADNAAEARATRKRQLPWELLCFWATGCTRAQSGRSPDSPWTLSFNLYEANAKRYKGVSAESESAYEALRAHCLNAAQCRAMGRQYGFGPLEHDLRVEDGGPRRQIVAWLETCVRLGWVGLSLTAEEMGHLLGLKVRSARKYIAELEDDGILAVVPMYKSYKGNATTDRAVFLPGVRFVAWAKTLKSKVLRRQACIRHAAGEDVLREYDAEYTSLTVEALDEYSGTVNKLQHNEIRAEEEKRHSMSRIDQLRDAGLDPYQCLMVVRDEAPSPEAVDACRRRNAVSPVGPVRRPTAAETVAADLGPVDVHRAYSLALRYDEYRYVRYCTPRWHEERQEWQRAEDARENEKRAERGLAPRNRGEMHVNWKLNTPNGEKDILARGKPPRCPASIQRDRYEDWQRVLQASRSRGPLPGPEQGPHSAADAARGQTEHGIGLIEAWLDRQGVRRRPGPPARAEGPLPGAGQGPHSAADAARGRTETAFDADKYYKWADDHYGASRRLEREGGFSEAVKG